VAAISVGIVERRPVLDLDYVEDVDAEVDMNVVMTGAGQFVEVQGAGEESTFSRAQLDRLISLGEVGIHQVSVAQKAALGDRWAW
jgi:ribonuclease PH